MVWCPSCAEEVEADYNESAAMTCCCNCGRVLEDAAFSSDVTFVKGADGDGELVGQFVNEDGNVRGLQRMAGGKLWSMRGDSHEVSLNKGRTELSAMIDHFVIRPQQDCLEAAHRLYRLAVQAGFTKGRVVPQVAACCLYIICRQEQKAIMLIDLSDLLQVNVYKLGSVYLQLTKLLRIDDHPSLTRPIDPSLYLHRFVEKLHVVDGSKQRVNNTAMRLIGQMKRDWMQTGRRPAGICGAALWMACHMHGIHKTKAEVMAVVHVGWATLDKRVREFSANAAAGLTLKEFEAAAEAAEQEQEALLTQLAKHHEQQHRQQRIAAGPSAAAGMHAEPDEAQEEQQLLNVCEHVAEGAAPHSAMGMCHECFKSFLQTSGGIWGDAANPPAFKPNTLEDEDEEEGVAPIGLLPAPGHGTDEEIMAEMAAEAGRQREMQQQELQQQQQQQQQQQPHHQQMKRGRGRPPKGAITTLGAAAIAAAAAAVDRGRGRGTRGRGRRGRPPKVNKEVSSLLGDGDGVGEAAAAGAAAAMREGPAPTPAGAAGDDEDDEVAAQVAELDTALHQLHDAVCHTGPAEQQHQQQQHLSDTRAEQLVSGSVVAAATAAAGASATALAAEDGSAEDSGAAFGASLLGYGSAYRLARQAERQKQQQLEMSAAKRSRPDEQQGAAAGGPSSSSSQPPGPSQNPPATPAQAGDGTGDDGFAAAVAHSATDGLGVPLDPSAAGLVQGAVQGTDGGLTAETGAIVPVGEASCEQDSGTDLEAVDDDEIMSYIRPEHEVKLKEILWNSMHKDWIAAQELKKANAEAAAAAAAEAERVAAENAAAFAAAVEGQGAEGSEGPGLVTDATNAAAAVAAAAGAGGKKKSTKPATKRGSQPRKPAALPEADTVHAAARANVEANKKLSDKINYKVLDDLFDSTRGNVAAASSKGGRSKAGSPGPEGPSVAANAAAGLGGPSFAEALAQQQQRRAAAEELTAQRYNQQLEEEARRRGGSAFDLANLSGLGSKASGDSAIGARSAMPRKGVGSARLGSLRR